MIKELTEKYQEKLEDNDLFSALEVDQINHKPHPYTIGPSHIRHANENGYGGMLDERVMQEVRCAHPKCDVPYEEHISTTVLFLQLKRNGNNNEAKEVLTPLLKEMESDRIEGFVMVESKEKFRIDE